MKKLSLAACGAVAACLMTGGPAVAQVTADSMGKVVPVHLYACSYKDGQGPADLEKTISRWSQYADEQGMEDYAAWTLTPYHFGPEQEFDVIWMGAYASGEVMGSGTDNWLETGREMQAAFNNVVDCNAHVALASAMYKTPADNATPDSGFITMMDCKLNEGRQYDEIRAAEMEWTEHLASTGSKAGYWHWFPVFGGGDADFDYKVVMAYPTFAEIGADFDRMYNAGGREMSEDTFGDIDECDDPRVYIANSRRSAQLRD